MKRSSRVGLLLLSPGPAPGPYTLSDRVLNSVQVSVRDFGFKVNACLSCYSASFNNLELLLCLEMMDSTASQ